MKKRAKGYLTVEASLTGTMAVIAAGIMISLCLYVYQRCWYTQAACETVLSGSSQGILKGSSAVQEAEEKWTVLKEEFYPLPTELSASSGGGKNEIRHTITGSTLVWGRNSLEFHVNAVQKLVRPVPFIRKTAALLELRE